jgi:hypothetical protein
MSCVRLRVGQVAGPVERGGMGSWNPVGVVAEFGQE